jgi:hypothetical protein
MSHDLNWLLRGAIDKPVYFVGNVRQEKKYGDRSYGLTLLAREYGFCYYRRDPESSNVSAFACSTPRTKVVLP